VDGSALARWTIRGLVVASAACLLAGAVAAAVTVRFVATAERAEGTVIANAQRVDRAAGDPQRSDVSFRPVVRFTTASGRAVTFESEQGSSPPRYRPGARVDVRYPAGDPAAARLASFSGQWALPLLLPAVALVLLATALLTRQFTQKTWAESQSAA
jgi:hypothetical protein